MNETALTPGQITNQLLDACKQALDDFLNDGGLDDGDGVGFPALDHAEEEWQGDETRSFSGWTPVGCPRITALGRYGVEFIVTIEEEGWMSFNTPTPSNDAPAESAFFEMSWTAYRDAQFVLHLDEEQLEFSDWADSVSDESIVGIQRL